VFPFVVCWPLAFLSEEQCLICVLMSDHDRPLSKAGRADAISVSNKLQQMGWIPELILCRCVPICVREYAWIILALQYEYGAHKL